MLINRRVCESLLIVVALAIGWAAHAVYSLHIRDVQSRELEAHWRWAIEAGESARDKAQTELETLMRAIHDAELSDEQRKSIGNFWVMGMQRRGIEIKHEQ